jgi:hypothetical protein
MRTKIQLKLIKRDVNKHYYKKAVITKLRLATLNKRCQWKETDFGVDLAGTSSI